MSSWLVNGCFVAKKAAPVVAALLGGMMLVSCSAGGLAWNVLRQVLS
jgi:hypothetical protein